jgi:hypothetical protein
MARYIIKKVGPRLPPLAWKELDVMIRLYLLATLSVVVQL